MKLSVVDYVGMVTMRPAHDAVAASPGQGKVLAGGHRPAGRQERGGRSTGRREESSGVGNFRQRTGLAPDCKPQKKDLGIYSSWDHIV